MNKVVKLLYRTKNLIVPEYTCVDNLEIPNDVFATYEDCSQSHQNDSGYIETHKAYTVDVYKLIIPASIPKMFCPIKSEYDFSDLILSHGNILAFCDTYHSLVNIKNVATFFLTKEFVPKEDDERLFAVKVWGNPGGKPSYIFHDFNDYYKYDPKGECSYQIVIPKLK